jgi:hypothetical protein
MAFATRHRSRMHALSVYQSISPVDDAPWQISDDAPHAGLTLVHCPWVPRRVELVYIQDPSSAYLHVLLPPTTTPVTLQTRPNHKHSYNIDHIHNDSAVASNPPFSAQHNRRIPRLGGDTRAIISPTKPTSEPHGHTAINRTANLPGRLPLS